MTRYPAHPQRRVALVSGASAGIGAATARALARQGHPVALGARRVDRCEAVAAEIRDAGGEAVGLALDVTDPASVKRFHAEVVEKLGDPDVLVSNAGSVGVPRSVRRSIAATRACACPSRVATRGWSWLPRTQFGQACAGRAAS